MGKISQDKLRKTDKIILKSKNNGDVIRVVFPNGIQVGLDVNGFNKGIRLLPSTPPVITDNTLYASSGKLFYGVTEVGSGGASAGGSATQIQYNSGSADGNTLAGDANLVFLESEGNLQNRVGINTATPKTALSFVNDFATTTFENQLADGESGGDIMKYGTGTTVAGELYYLHTDGAWADANANAVVSGADQLLGIALGTNPASHGMLLKGFAKIASTLVNGTAAIGKAVFMSTTAGEYDFTKPSGSNDVVRIAGYCVDIDSSDILLYFNPDPTFIEIS